MGQLIYYLLLALLGFGLWRWSARWHIIFKVLARFFSLVFWLGATAFVLGLFIRP